MDDPSTGALFGFFILLVIVSAYFSGSETAMMALNRYRLKHLAKEGHGGAKRASSLLERPDRLLGVILIGNNLANFTAASLATLLALEILGEHGVAAAPILCTLVFLVFAEVAPKTIAAVYPEKLALPSSYLLKLLLWVTYPLVWMVNGMANGMLKLFGVERQTEEDHLSLDELRTVVYEGSRIAGHRQDMMLSVLDLDKMTVDDIMIPRPEIVGIDLEDDIEDIATQLRSVQHTRLPVFKEDVEQVVGLLHIRNAAKFLIDDELTVARLMEETQKPYFVPENTPLLTQLRNFQVEKQRMALVVDEYGDVQGIITLEDILEEIVGDFTTDAADASSHIHPQADGSYLIDGGAHIREINRTLGWELPTDGAKTLNGLITETLEAIPEANVGLTINGYRIELVQIQDNMIKTAKIMVPHLP
ncbi:MAG: HlyC/CorC family transporter [Pseudomonadales bacterium]